MEQIAGIGHNGGPALDDDERLPPKSERVLDKALAAKVLIAVTMAAKRCAIARKAVTEKRKGGEEGRFLRGFSIWYTRSLGAPVWQAALIWDLDRKQIGQEEAAFIEWLSRNEELAEEAEHLTDMCDAALRFDHIRFMREGLSERIADAAAKKALKTLKEASDLLEAPVKATARPRGRELTAAEKRRRAEAERLAQEAQERRRREARNAEIALHMAVIRKGAEEGATKAQKRDAVKAARALNLVAGKKPA